MIKHYFRRRNPVLYGKDSAPKAAPVANEDVVSAFDPVAPKADAEPEYVKLITVLNNTEQSVVESLLRSEEIPYVIREENNESWKRAIMGMTSFGADIFVPADLLETAATLITGDAAPAGDTDDDEPTGDLAELGLIPDIVADAGGWVLFNKAHGLDPDNRELPGDLAELADNASDGESR